MNSLVKVLCSTCNIEGQLQQIGNSGNYYRIAHYKMVDGKARYHYYQVSKEYALQQLSLKGVTISKRSKVKPKVQSMNKGDLVNKSIDQNKTESSLKEVNGAAERTRTFDLLINSQLHYRAVQQRQTFVSATLG